mgnify:CR=1 FL=1
MRVRVRTKLLKSADLIHEFKATEKQKIWIRYDPGGIVDYCE